MGHFPKGYKSFAQYNRFKQHVPWGTNRTGPYGIAAAPIAWWKSDTLAGLSNGASVTSWADSSPNGWTLVTEAAAPTWDTSVLGGSVKFVAASTQALTNTLFSSLANLAQATVFVVAKYDAAGAGGSLMYTTGFGNVFGYNPSGFLVWYPSGSSNLAKYAFTDTTAAHVFEGVYDGTQSTNATKETMYLDGTSKNPLTATGTLPTTFGALSNGIVVARTATLGAYLDGHIAEIALFPSVLSSTDRSTVRQALGTKYSLTVTP